MNKTQFLKHTFTDDRERTLQYVLSPVGQPLLARGELLGRGPQKDVLAERRPRPSKHLWSILRDVGPSHRPRMILKR